MNKFSEVFSTAQQFEKRLPDELVQHIRESSIVLLPVGAMEWHGPHMGMGVDTTHAYAVSLQVAQAVGAVVYPPLFLGTETYRSRKTLRKIGFSGRERIKGMDFPVNSVKSVYCSPRLLKQVVRFHVKALRRLGFRYIFLMNGHGADAQIAVLHRICQKYSSGNKYLVRSLFVLFDDAPAPPGHAGLAETAIMQYLQPESVCLGKLKSEGKIKNTEYAIVDSETFEKGANEDRTVRYDPRDATEPLGEQMIAHSVRRCTEIIKTYMAREEMV